MTPYDYVVDYGQKHIWCTPRQDLQSIVAPWKLTPLGGVWNTVNVQWRTIPLPLQSVHFHVYQIGQLNPQLLGLLDMSGKWESFSDIMGRQNLIVDIYANNGVQMPRYACWYKWTKDKNLIVAIQVQPTININLDTDQIYLRFYKNAWYNSAEKTSGAFITTVGQTCLNTTEILAMQNGYQTIKAAIAAGSAAYPGGKVYAFVNGMRVSGPDLFTVQPGDCVEYVYDSSIYNEVEFQVSALPSFPSTLDSKPKYLLHYPGYGTQIDYQDDIDMWIHPAADSQGRWAGVYYHRNAADAVRMVTHKDYALPVDYVQGYLNDQPTWGVDVGVLTIKLHIRKSGWTRPLVYENNRIFEMYKLSDADVVQAMVGTNSVVPNWTAPVLEASPYTQLMAANLRDINNALVASALGYNALSEVIGMTPEFTTVESGQTVAYPPYVLADNCTGWEYDVNGKLIGFFQHPYGTTYPCSTSFCNLVEFIGGQGGFLLDEYYGQQGVSLVANANYRYYTCPIDPVTNLPTFQWTDVTGTSQYVVQNNIVTWLIDQTKFYTLVRGDNKHLAYSFELQAQAGLLEFSLTQQAVRLNNVTTIVMEIPMGELYLWLNDNFLVEGVDYIMNFPQIVITNKQYLENVATQAQNITVRFTGFCNSDLSVPKANDVGFVRWGRLSDNNIYDVRDDKVVSIFAGGSYYDRSQLEFQEDTGNIVADSSLNGSPYQIRDIVVPLRSLVAEDTYTARAASEAIDTIVSEYMTSKLDETDPSTPSVIPKLWNVYSPFFCKILNDLLSGQLAPSWLTGNYADTDVIQACQPYTYLLAFDQTQTGLIVDPNFVVVEPHNLPTVVTISIYVYKFMTRVNRLFLHNTLSLSKYLNIQTIV
jgi:hypothetical protein